MCFGTFDGMHAGHEDFFRQAKDHGDELIVIVARDVTVLDVKGDLPGINENDRLATVSNHPFVDDARFGNPGDKYKIIEEVQPDIICLGYDQEAFTENLDAELSRRGLSASIVRCRPYYPDTMKSSLLRGARVDDEDIYAEVEYEEGMPL